MKFSTFQRMCVPLCFISSIGYSEAEIVFSENFMNVSKAMETGWSLKGFILGIIPYISFEKCLEECLSRKRCQSLNYKQQFPLCELNYKKKSTKSEFELSESKGTVYTEIAEWRESKKIKCNPDLCDKNQRCTLSDSGQVCVNSDCGKEVPKKRCAVADKSQGISIDSKVTYSCPENFNLIGKPSITCQPNGKWSSPRFKCKEEAFDCSDIMRQGKNKTEVYKISPLCQSISVLCHMEEDGGGWTVLTNRINDSSNFNRTWDEYKRGFGSASGNYWIGNDYIHQLTTVRSMELLFVLESKYGNHKYRFKYKNFKVGKNSQEFLMTFDFQPEYLNFNMTPLLPYKQLCNMEDPPRCHNTTTFSTYDKDGTGSASCPGKYGGGWWYNECHHVSLTGGYDVHVGYRWKYLNGTLEDEGYLKSSLMMIRPAKKKLAIAVHIVHSLSIGNAFLLMCLFSIRSFF